MNIQIRQGEFGEASGEDTISSGAFCTCVIVGIWDNELKIGYILHDDAPTNHRILPEFLEVVFLKSQKDNLIVKVYGGGEMGEDHQNYIIDNRDYVKSIIEETFLRSQIEIRWFDEVEGGDLIINPETGEFLLLDA